MKKFIALTLTLILAIATATALAVPDARIENLEYKGFGIIEIEFSRDCAWYENAVIALNDASGAELPFQIVGGEEENCFLRAATLTDGTSCTLDFTLGGSTQSITFDAVTGTEYYVRMDGTVNPRRENDRCDYCHQIGHDEDYCPEFIDADNIPEDIDELAWLFDIDRCERCNGIGHDDDRCPN